jgi:hypothetical protein
MGDSTASPGTGRVEAPDNSPGPHTLRPAPALTGTGTGTGTT